MARYQTATGAARRTALRWIWPPDKWERLSTVADLVQAPGDVLDVGGRGREMSWLLRGRTVRSVNVEPPADVVVPPGELPFRDRSWATVVSTDVLEHVPPDQRAGFVTELIRVADRRVVLCFPCWTPAKAAAEQRLAETLSREHDVRFDFLDEHLEHGLPAVTDTVAVVERVLPDAEITCWYDNNLGPGDEFLLDAVRLRYGHDLRVVGRVVRGWVRRPAPLLERGASATASRAYLVIDRPARG